MVRYWSAKKEAFGDGRLFALGKIRIDDLDEDAIFALYNSIFMALPTTDAHGRAVIFTTRQGWAFRSRDSMVRRNDMGS